MAYEQNTLLMGLEPGKSKVKVLEDLPSGESCFLVHSLLSLCPQMAKGERGLSGASLIRALI